MPMIAQAAQAASQKLGGQVLGGAQFLYGLSEEKKAKKALQDLHQPFYKIQDEYIQNRNIAAGMAGSGLPSATKDYLTNASEKALGTSIAAILSSGGSPNDISRLFDTFQSSVDKTAAEDAQLRTENLKYFMDTNRDLAGQKNIAFGINELQPYESALKSITERRAAGVQNMFGGLQTYLGVNSAAGVAGLNSDMMKSGSSGGTNPVADMHARLFTDTGNAVPRTSTISSLNSAKGINYLDNTLDVQQEIPNIFMKR